MTEGNILIRKPGLDLREIGTLTADEVDAAEALIQLIADELLRGAQLDDGPLERDYVILVHKVGGFLRGHAKIEVKKLQESNT